MKFSTSTFQLNGQSHERATTTFISSSLNAARSAAISDSPLASGGAAPAQGGGGGDANVARAEHELGLIERQVEPMQPGDARLADRFLADLDRIGQTLNALPDKSTAEWQAADAHRAKLRSTIVEKRVASLRDALQKEIDKRQKKLLPTIDYPLPTSKKNGAKKNGAKSGTKSGNKK